MHLNQSYDLLIGENFVVCYLDWLKWSKIYILCKLKYIEHRFSKKNRSFSRTGLYYPKLRPALPVRRTSYITTPPLCFFTWQVRPYVSFQLSYQPIMCSYKLVDVEFNIWGLSYRVENYVHSVSKTSFSLSNDMNTHGNMYLRIFLIFNPHC